jgi:hypothetical protein
MDQKKLSNILEQSVATLESLKNRTYVSTLIYVDGKLFDKKTNNFNNWETVFFDKKLYDDCLLLKIVETMHKMQSGEESVVLWSADTKNDHIQQARHEHGLYQGISLIVKIDKNTVFCMSACTSKEQNAQKFHADFLGKRQRLSTIIQRETACTKNNLM